MSGRWRVADLADHLGVDPNAESPPSARARRTGTPRHSTRVRGVEPQREVPPYIAGLLEEEPSDVGEKRSGQTFKLVLSALEAGYSDEEILWLVHRHAPSVDKYGDLDIEVERILDKRRDHHNHVGEDCVEAGCPNTSEWLRARRRLADVRQLAVGYDWNYPGGSTDRLVLDYLLEVGERAGKATVSASVREIAKAVNRTKDTVSRSLRRLRGDIP